MKVKFRLKDKIAWLFSPCRRCKDGFKKRLNTEIRACRTCQNPYCSRTLKERQEREVQVHWQYGWECEDKEKWLSHSGGFEFIKKEKKKTLIN